MSNDQPVQETVDHASRLRESLQLWIAVAGRYDMLGIEGALREMLEDADALTAEKTHLHDLWIAECGRTETLADDADKLYQQVDALLHYTRMVENDYVKQPGYTGFWTDAEADAFVKELRQKHPIAAALLDAPDDD